MEKKQIDPKSRDYDFKDIKVDERFRQTWKEFLITLGTYLVFIALMVSNLFIVGGTEVTEYRYILGFPQWIFNEIVILIGMVIAVIVIVTFVYKDMDITPTGKVQDKKERREQA